MTDEPSGQDAAAEAPAKGDRSADTSGASGHATPDARGGDDADANAGLFGDDARAGVDLAGPDRDAAAVGCGGGPAEGPGSLTDPRTCLTWQKQKGPALSNVQAARYCADLVLDGYSDWRVPAPEELATWPNLTADSNAYITNPTYIPVAASAMDGCTGDSHSCNLAEYNAGSPSCAWQGVGFLGATVCVRAVALPGTVASQYAADNCDVCKAHVSGAAMDFKLADCLPYAR